MPAPLPDLSQIQLIGGYFVECAILNDAPDTVIQLNPQRFKLHHKVLPSFSSDDQIVLIDLTVHCQPVNEAGQLSPVSGRFRLHLTFHVSNLSEYLESGEEHSTPAPSQQLILTIIGVAYSTARGLIAGKTADTILKPFVLPLLDVRELVNPKNQMA
jgi:hypothetical protein